MSVSTPRVRMFAGPNGSGKSTLKSYLSPKLLGVFVNPDEIEQKMRDSGRLDLSSYIKTEAEEVLSFFKASSFLASAGLGSELNKLHVVRGCLDVSAVAVNSYMASVAADFLRKKLLEARASFTFETVMSHPSKLDLLLQARALGYRTYLYFIATDDPEINISRVRNRVKLGGHSVPEVRIAARYYRSLTLLKDAILLANRAYIFDNSGENADHKHTWLAEITEARTLALKTQRIPVWFKRAVLDKLTLTML